MNNDSPTWEKIFEGIQELVDLYLRECDDLDQCEDDIIEKIYEIKARTKKYIYVALQE